MRERGRPLAAMPSNFNRAIDDEFYCLFCRSAHFVTALTLVCVSLLVCFEEKLVLVFLSQKWLRLDFVLVSQWLLINNVQHLPSFQVIKISHMNRLSFISLLLRHPLFVLETL